MHKQKCQECEEIVCTCNQGKKFDTGKPRLDLVDGYFPNALKGVADVCAHGAKLHGEYTWDSIPDAKKRYTAAIRRHQIKIANGETHDLELNAAGEQIGSELPHSVHVAWNALALAELETRKAVKS